MQIFRHTEDRELSLQGSVATLGNFDGIHLGHQALLRSAVATLDGSEIPPSS